MFIRSWFYVDRRDLPQAIQDAFEVYSFAERKAALATYHLDSAVR